MPGPFSPPATAQLSSDDVTKLVRDSIPLDGDTQSLIWHPATQSVYVIGRGRLAINRTVIRVPVSQWLATAAGVTIGQLVPMCVENEKRAAQSPAKAQ